MPHSYGYILGMVQPQWRGGREAELYSDFLQTRYFVRIIRTYTLNLNLSCQFSR